MRWQVCVMVLAAALLPVASIHAGMIGMNMAGPGETGVVSGENIGVTGVYQQSNWNNKFTTPGLPTTHYGFVDNNGNSLGTDENGFYVKMWSYGSVGLGNDSVPGITAPLDSGPRNETNNTLAGNLFNGYFLLNSNDFGGEGALTFHFFNIPYEKFDVVIYTGNSDSNMLVRSAVGATEWNIAGTPVDGNFTNHGILTGVNYQATWQESSHDGTTGGNYFVIKDLTTLNNDGHLDLQMYRGSSAGWGLIFAVQIVEVPEPSTLALAGFGLVGLLCYAWRRRR